jgi:hypothetical protein
VKPSGCRQLLLLLLLLQADCPEQQAAAAVVLHSPQDREHHLPACLLLQAYCRLLLLLGRVLAEAEAAALL